jgi:hypothetical protein
MKLSDIVSAAQGLAVYAEVALLLFFAAFLAVLVQVTSKKRASEWEAAGSLPLEDDGSPPSSHACTVLAKRDLQ